MVLNSDDKPQRSVETAVLGLLFVLFLIGIYRCETIEQKADTRDQPSTLADTRPGAGALYVLLQNLGYPVDRLTDPWDHLDQTSSVLVVLEPLSRDPSESENKPLRNWIERGGTLLFVCTGPPQSEDPSDAVAGDVRLDAARKVTSHPTPANHELPYTRGVKSLCVSSPVRITPSQSARYQILFRDDQGILAVHKRMGRGHVILMANDLIATNWGIAQDDNSIFLVNVAAAGTAGTRSHGALQGRVVFDEYHHGVGFETENPGGIGVLVQHMPGPLKWTLLDLLAFALIIVYIGNLRRGPLLRVSDDQVRPSGDYVRSMARLYRRAGARDVVIQTIYNRLLRDLRHELNLSPDTSASQIALPFSESFEAHSSRLKSIIDRCERSVAGSSMSEHEMVSLAASIDQFRRECGIVGHQ